MSIAPSLLKKILSVLVITIFSISLLFVGLTNLQPKSVLAYGINIQTACSNTAENELYYNTGLSNNYYLVQNKQDYCDSAAFRCLFSNCSDGFNADETINKTCNFTISQGFTNCGNNTIIYPIYSSNYPYNNNCKYNYNTCYDNCVNCFEQAISQLQNGVNSYNLGNATVDQDLLNNITNSGRLDIPSSITSYINGDLTGGQTQHGGVDQGLHRRAGRGAGLGQLGGITEYCSVVLMRSTTANCGLSFT